MPCHAVRAAIGEALRAREAVEKKVILIGLSGHGHFDMSACEPNLSGELQDAPHSDEALAESLRRLPVV